MYIDILCLAATAYGFFLGFKEGIVNTVFRTLSIFIAIMAAFKFSPYMTEMLEKGFEFDNPLIAILIYFYYNIFIFFLWPKQKINVKEKHIFKSTKLQILFYVEAYNFTTVL